MRISSGLYFPAIFLAAFTLAFAPLSSPAFAQGQPEGAYVDTDRDNEMEGAIMDMDDDGEMEYQELRPGEQPQRRMGTRAPARGEFPEVDETELDAADTDYEDTRGIGNDAVRRNFEPGTRISPDRPEVDVDVDVEEDDLEDLEDIETLEDLEEEDIEVEDIEIENVELD